MSMKRQDDHLTARQQRASEYLLEDEGLTGDLVDDQARPLLDWATSQANLVAADPARSDDEVQAMVKAIRRAVRHIASTAADEYDPQRLVALAAQKLVEEQTNPPAERAPRRKRRTDMNVAKGTVDADTPATETATDTPTPATDTSEADTEEPGC